ncbi:hypothetical protein AJ79_07689 [Helicocarpus griseus UAMH5409]|uniref:FAD-binding PCMH-type domain-containing protein n=1 Tax=Helicocarpus griseus UAMH5409 TaxID=1447875 RepID=A0A2B7X077_9EURO|nr:hypothetical protein AJ79_07689 [Helicocarpus griseus UAMH5409]
MMGQSWMAATLGGLLLQAVPGLAQKATGECCSELSTQLQDKVFFPSTPGYNTSMEGFWTLQATFDTPTCIVVPSCTADVSTAVKTLVAGQCKFSVKGGGHTPFAGAASISDGVQIDMTSMNSVTVNEDRTVAQIGAGARWLKVYQELQPQKLMVAGGRDSDVGVGGLILGGGYSWFTTKRGFVADGVVNIELVKADGEVINVNAESYPDLFVGLKGGGNNFGIATRFDLKAFPFETMWGGKKVYPNTTTDAQIRAFVNFNENAHTDPHANLINYFNYDSASKEHIVFNVIDYNIPVEDPPIYDEIKAIPDVAIDTMRIGPVSDFTEELSSASQRNRNIFLTITFDNDFDMYKKAVEISNSHLKPFLEVPGLIWSLLFQPIPAVISEASKANGGNILGIDRNSKNQILYLLYLTWTDPADDEALHAAAYDTLDEIKKESIKSGTANPYIYLNYAGEFQDVLSGYGVENVLKMKELSAKYDPDGVFQKLVPGGWKIADVI